MELQEKNSSTNSSMTEASTDYDESKIKTLSSIEHIRLRPGMYIGRLGNGSHPDDGIYILLKEVIDNAGTSAVGAFSADFWFEAQASATTTSGSPYTDTTTVTIGA